MCLIASIITGTEAEYQSDTGSTKYLPYLALTGELWGVFCGYLWENWSRYNGTALYMKIMSGYITHLVLSDGQVHTMRRCVRHVSHQANQLWHWWCGFQHHTPSVKITHKVVIVIKIIIYIFTSYYQITLLRVCEYALGYVIYYMISSCTLVISYFVLWFINVYIYIYIVECRYNAVQYIIILHKEYNDRNKT